MIILDLLLPMDVHMTSENLNYSLLWKYNSALLQEVNFVVELR